MNILGTFLPGIIKNFRTYKGLGDKTIAQLREQEINFRQDEHSNSMALIVKHMHGNMISRWTDFLTSDGEKPDRNRDREFDGDIADKASMLKLWEEGWACLFHALESLKEEDLGRTVYIRSEAHTVLEAVTRQVMHYSYHVGQMVYLGKLIRGGSFQSLSIPKGKSEEFNKGMLKK
ncbi:MAG: DUF1572 family protein [Bacteroidia bacterium]